jgi:glucose/arabinose dehydrogenase
MRFPRLITAALAAVFVLGVPAANAGVTTVPAFTGTVTAPMYVTSPPGDSHRLFIVTRPGVIDVAVDGVLQPTPFLDIHQRVWQSGEAGMASMAFDPGFSDAASPGYGRFYVYFVQTPAMGQTNGPIHIEEFSADPSANVASTSAPRLVLEIPHNNASNHYGGTLQFSPVNGLLYIGTGDGGGADNQYGNAQSTTKSLLGKLLRIDPHVTATAPYSIPDGNPYKGQALCNPPSGTTNCPEILAYGLRNPFRWSFDRATGDIAIGDVGQSLSEEIDYVPTSATLAGDNFGWPCFEGTTSYKEATDPECTGGPYVDPVATYGHAGLSGPVAITGGVVVRDPALTPLLGRYLYADFYQGKIHSLELATPSATGDRLESLPVIKQLVSFGEDAGGHVYIVSLAGSVSKLVCDQAGCDPTPPTPPTTPAPPADSGGTVATADPGGSAGAAPADTPVAAPAQPVAVRDTLAPRLRVRSARTQDVLRRGFVRLSVACDEPCLVRASGRARGGALRGLLERIPAGTRVTFELRATATVRRALAQRGSVALTLRARDAAGNLRTASVTVRVKR